MLKKQVVWVLSNSWRQWTPSHTWTSQRKKSVPFSRNMTGTTRDTSHLMTCSKSITTWRRTSMKRPWLWCWKKPTATMMEKSVLKISTQLWSRQATDWLGGWKVNLCIHWSDCMHYCIEEVRFSFDILLTENDGFFFKWFEGMLNLKQSTKCLINHFWFWILTLINQPSKIKLKIQIVFFPFDGLFINVLRPPIPVRSHTFAFIMVAFTDLIHLMNAVIVYVLCFLQISPYVQRRLVFILLFLFYLFWSLNFLSRTLLLCNLLGRDWRKWFEKLFLQNEFHYILGLNLVPQLPQKVIQLFVAFINLPKTVSEVTNHPELSQKVLLKFWAFSSLENRLVNHKFVPLFFKQLNNIVFQNAVDSKFVQVRVDSEFEKLFFLFQLFKNGIGFRLLFVF